LHEAIFLDLDQDYLEIPLKFIEYFLLSLIMSRTNWPSFSVLRFLTQGKVSFRLLYSISNSNSLICQSFLLIYDFPSRLHLKLPPSPHRFSSIHSIWTHLTTKIISIYHHQTLRNSLGLIHHLTLRFEGL
jgi:hypothetical protein